MLIHGQEGLGNSGLVQHWAQAGPAEPGVILYTGSLNAERIHHQCTHTLLWRYVFAGEVRFNMVPSSSHRSN